MPKTPINIRLPDVLLDRVTAAAEARGHTRTRWIEDALERALETRAPISTPDPDILRAATGRARHLPQCKCPTCKPPRKAGPA